MDRGTSIAVNLLNPGGAGGDAIDHSRETDREIFLLVDRHGAAELAAGGVQCQPGRQRRSVVERRRPDRAADRGQRGRWRDADPGRIHHEFAAIRVTHGDDAVGIVVAVEIIGQECGQRQADAAVFLDLNGIGVGRGPLRHRLHVDHDVRGPGYRSLFIAGAVGQGEGTVEILGGADLEALVGGAQRQTTQLLNLIGGIDHHLGDHRQRRQLTLPRDLQPHRYRANELGRRHPGEAQLLGIESQPGRQRRATLPSHGQLGRIAQIEGEQSLGLEEGGVGEQPVDRRVDRLMGIDDELKGEAAIRGGVVILGENRCCGGEHDLHPRGLFVRVRRETREAELQRQRVESQPVGQGLTAGFARRPAARADVEQGDVAVIGERSVPCRQVGWVKANHLVVVKGGGAVAHQAEAERDLQRGRIDRWGATEAEGCRIEDQPSRQGAATEPAGTNANPRVENAGVEPTHPELQGCFMGRADVVAAEHLVLKTQRLAQAAGQEIKAGVGGGVSLWIVDPNVESQAFGSALRRYAADDQGGGVEMQPRRQG